mmetsp:Transcript_12793/g.38571  ORF Transcript_12793/g.38571 Transcript_12793/m.38571 type:complete len:333 (+) Transcript_12793:634-1632(+)
MLARLLFASPSILGSEASTRRTSCSWATEASASSASRGSCGSHTDPSSLPSATSLWNSSTFPRAHTALSVHMFASSLRASRSETTADRIFEACAATGRKASRRCCAATPSPYTADCRRSLSLCCANWRRMGMIWGRYWAPPAGECSSRSSMTHTPMRRSPLVLPGPVSSWPMAGMRGSTKGKATSPHLRSATEMTADTPSSTSSSASFSSSRASASSSSKSSAAVRSPRSVRRSSLLRMTSPSSRSACPSRSCPSSSGPATPRISSTDVSIDTSTSTSGSLWRASRRGGHTKSSSWAGMEASWVSRFSTASTALRSSSGSDCTAAMRTSSWK